MKKQIMLFTTLASFFSWEAYAGNTYVGGSLSMQRISATSSQYTGYRPGLFIGYGQEYPDCYYLGGEFLGSMTGATSDSYVLRDISLRMAPVYSLSLIPGMLITEDTMGFLRLGIGVGKLKASARWLTGYVLGAGVDVPLSPSWDIRFEYDYTLYNHIGIGNPQSHELMLSLKY